MPSILVKKATRVVARRCDGLIGRLRPLEPVLRAMAERPCELHLELTNVCNARCIFCPYTKQKRPHQFMSDTIFERALEDYRREGGGDVFFTPIVGEALIHPLFLDRVQRAASFPEIDGLKVVTNATLVHRFGAQAIIDSGLTEIFISTAGFDEAMYNRVYRNYQYHRMRDNVLALLEANRRAGNVVNMTIGLRSDRPLRDVKRDPDFQALLEYEPQLDFTWAFTSAGGRVPSEELPEVMRVRKPPPKVEPCVSSYNGPIVLPGGEVLACSCVAAMDALEDLQVGHLLEDSLGDIWRSHRVAELRAGFGTAALNPTCAACGMYRDLELYRTREGRQRARDSRERGAGCIVRRRRHTSLQDPMEVSQS